MRKVDISESLLKAAAISGIAFAWANFTLKAFKVAWHIISTSPEEYTFNVVSMAVCEECQSRFLDDGNELENERFLCENCRKPNESGENNYF